MILTPMLPNAGTGTAFTFSAYADDSDGNTTLLGRHTVAIDNATSVTLFGTIDTPQQGATVSGTSYPNFGWVLTPQPKRIQLMARRSPSSSTASLSDTRHNLRRDDVAGLFPTLWNANGAIDYSRLTRRATRTAHPSPVGRG